MNDFIRIQRAPDFSTATLLFYGLPGAGKTTLGCRAGNESNRLILDCEGGAKAQVGAIATINSLDALNKVIRFLGTKDGQHYEYVVLDGLDALYRTIYEQSDFGKDAKDKRLSHVGPSQGLAEALRKLASLPIVKIIIAHAKVEKTGRDEKTRSSYSIDMPPSLKLIIEGLVDVGIYCWRARSGNYMMAADSFESDRGSVWGKDRSGKLGARHRRQDWATIEQALGLEPPKPKDNE